MNRIRQQDILIEAFQECEREKMKQRGEKLYDYLRNIPTISTTVLVIDKLNKLGYEITKTQ